MKGLTQRHRDTEDGRARVKLGEVCEEIRARISSTAVGIDAYVTTDNMLKNCAGITRAEYVPEDVGLVRYQKGDVLLANIRPYLKKLWRADRDGGCSSDVVVFRSCREDLSSEYLFAALSQDRFFDYVMQKPRGTKMPRGDRDWMKEFPFPLPPLPVQREIVARLERELGAVEKVAAKFEELEAAAEAEFKAELKETFEDLTQRHGDTEGGGEPRVFAPSGRARTPAAPQASVVRRVKLGEVCESISSRGHQIKQSEISEVGRFPVVSQSENAIEGYTDREIAIFETPLVLFGDHTCAVKLIDKPFVVGADGVKLLRVSNCLPHYLYFWLQQAVMKLLDGEYRRHFTDLCELIIPLPPLSVQREIVGRLDAAREWEERLVSAAKRGREAAAQWRKAILKEAFE